MDTVSELGHHLEIRFWNTPIERKPLADEEVSCTARLIWQFLFVGMRGLVVIFRIVDGESSAKDEGWVY
jgi:hypothetical protein